MLHSPWWRKPPNPLKSVCQEQNRCCTCFTVAREIDIHIFDVLIRSYTAEAQVRPACFYILLGLLCRVRCHPACDYAKNNEMLHWSSHPVRLCRIRGFSRSAGKSRCLDAFTIALGQASERDEKCWYASTLELQIDGVTRLLHGMPKYSDVARTCLPSNSPLLMASYA